MVKGISKQVIVVHAPDPKLFEQAIFILKEGVEGVTDEKLLKEAKGLIGTPVSHTNSRWQGLIYALGGGGAVGIAWLISLFL